MEGNIELAAKRCLMRLVEIRQLITSVVSLESSMTELDDQFIQKSNGVRALDFGSLCRLPAVVSVSFYVSLCFCVC